MHKVEIYDFSSIFKVVVVLQNVSEVITFFAESLNSFAFSWDKT